MLLSGIALGVSIAAPPGPVTALAAQEVASRSWLAGWLVTVGATTADGVFFVLAYFGLSRLLTAQERDALFLVGGSLMLYLAASAVARARGGGTARSPGGRLPSALARSPFLAGLSMGLTNPYQLAWWIAVGAGMVAEFGAEIAVGFFAGIVAWTLVFTGAVSAGVARYERAAPLVAYGAAVLMAAFGLWFLAVGAGSLLP